MEEYLRIGVWHGALAAVVTFFGAWFYCASTYGFLLGFGLGWIASALLAFIVYLVVAFLWLPIDLAIASFVWSQRH